MQANHGDRPVDAAYRAIDAITGIPLELLDFNIESATSGKDAIGLVSVKVTDGQRVAKGRASDTDVVVAAAKAYINAINALLLQEDHVTEKTGM